MKFPPNRRSTFRLAIALMLAGIGVVAVSAPTSNIAVTKHNLSAAGPGTFKAQGTTQTSEVCVYCHTPHGKPNLTGTRPLWNRTINTAQTYTSYSSSSIDATDMGTAQPGAESKLCLSCHDGMLAVNTVSVLAGKTGGAAANAGISVTFQGDTNAGKMPTGLGTNTGFTRNLGTDLRNDHPIGMTFNDTLATNDGEMRPPSTSGGLIGARQHQAGAGYLKPTLPLDPSGKVQCISCHDPHFDAQKFLRLNRFQTNAQAGSSFSANNDQICLGCHSRLGSVWGESAHANQIAGDEEYANGAATNRDFPTSPKKKVWEVGCLNCHDTHTVAGSRRLLREGVNSTTSGAGASLFYTGVDISGVSDLSTTSAIENTCYQCHDQTATRILDTTGSPTGTVPNIKDEFSRARRMPIVSSAQGNLGTAGREVHDISSAAGGIGPGGSGAAADFLETQTNLGRGAIANRHVECTDCHNPHRLRRASLFSGTSANSGEGAKRTHNLGGPTGNIASGVLRGAWGVEPDYSGVSTSSSWPELPTIGTAQIKRGDPGASTATGRTQTYVTREYQVCLKCHSNFANSDFASSYPDLGYPGGTTSGSNGVTRYTNVAAEYSALANDTLTGADQGESGNDPAYTPGNPNGAPNSAPTNHRSWHPVLFPTGRTAWERTGSSSQPFTNIRSPFNTQANIGQQTMYCSDCHGSGQSWSQKNFGDDTNGPNLSQVQGPHGSDNNFLLKGMWDITVTIGDADGSNTRGVICGRCHAPVSGKGGFSNGDAAHSKSDHTQLARCMFCHIAMPHGWKNKAFLVNLLCIGPEVGKPAGCSNAFNDSGEVTKQLWVAPYYNGALLRVTSWKTSNAWTETSCGSGSGWMSGTCQNAKTTQQAQSTGY